MTVALLDKLSVAKRQPAHLRLLSGKRHKLHSAAVIAEGGTPVWREVDTATLFVRPLGEPFIDSYLDAEWPAIAGCVGCYRIEGPGAQLFARIDGSHFTVLGLPLLPVLDCLRVRGVLASMILRPGSGQVHAEVIGDPIAQSKSPVIHKFWLKVLGLEGDYAPRTSRATIYPRLYLPLARRSGLARVQRHDPAQDRGNGSGR